MGLISKVLYLKETKDLIEDGLKNVGTNITEYDTFSSYPDIVDDLYNNWPRVTASGETATLEQTMKAPLNIDLKGNTSQTGTPTPSSPINVNVVSGDNEVVVCGKNLVEGKIENYYIISNGTFLSGAYDMQIARVVANNTYTITTDQSGLVAGFFTSYPTINSTSYDGSRIVEVNKTFTAPINGYIAFRTGHGYEYPQLEKGNSSSTYEPYTSQNYPLYLGVENLFDNILEVGSIDANGNNVSSTDRVRSTNYIKVEPNTTYYLSSDFGSLSVDSNVFGRCYNSSKTYVSALSITKNGSFTIPSDVYYFRIQYIVGNGNQQTAINNHNITITKGSTQQYISDTPIELNKIGTYQDYIYKNGSKWYLHKEVGKVMLNGSESDWAGENFGSYRRYNLPINDIKDITANADFEAYSDYFYKDIDTLNSANCLPGMMCQFRNTKKVYFISSESSIVSWLSTHNTTLYYVLATPTNTEITNTTLINQLEALKGAMSYEGQTNISQVNNDLPFILTVEALKGSAE